MASLTTTVVPFEEPLPAKMVIPSRWGSHVLGQHLPTHILALHRTGALLSFLLHVLLTMMDPSVSKTASMTTIAVLFKGQLPAKMDIRSVGLRHATKLRHGLPTNITALVPLLPHKSPNPHTMHPSVSKMEDMTMTAVQSREPLHVKMDISFPGKIHVMKHQHGPLTSTLALVQLLLLNREQIFTTMMHQNVEKMVDTTMTAAL